LNKLQDDINVNDLYNIGISPSKIGAPKNLEKNPSAA